MADYTDYIEIETPEYGKYGFKSVYYLNNHILTCPVCFALVERGDVYDKESTPWWKHIQFHRELHKDDSTFGWQWPFQPRENP